MHHLPIHYETNDPDFQQLSDFVVSEMRRLSVPGVAIGLFHNGREHLAGFGVTSVENPLPVTADTLFQGRVLHPRHDNGCGEGFPFDMAHSTISGQCDAEPEVDATSAGAEGQAEKARVSGSGTMSRGM